MDIAHGVPALAAVFVIKYYHYYIFRQLAVSSASVLTWFLAHGGWTLLSGRLVLLPAPL